VHVANHLGDAERGWSELARDRAPGDEPGFAALFGPLDLWLPWPTALRGTLAALALFWATAVWTLARALHPARAWLGLALGGAAFGWTFYMGFFSFHLATSLGLFALAWAVASAAGDTGADRGALARARRLVAILHVMSAALTGALLAALFWRRAPRGMLGQTALVVAAIALPALCVAIALVWPGSAALGEPGAAPGSAPAPWWALAKCFTGGPAWRAWPLTLLAIAALLVALARRSSPRSAEDEALLVAGGAVFAAAAWLPLSLASWEYFSPRFLPIGVGALVLALPIERLARPLRAAASLALAAFAFAATAWAWTYHESFADVSAEALSGLDAAIVPQRRAPADRARHRRGSGRPARARGDAVRASVGEPWDSSTLAGQGGRHALRLRHEPAHASPRRAPRCSARFPRSTARTSRSSRARDAETPRVPHRASHLSSRRTPAHSRT
jgi:hypothetical protein